MYEPEDGEESCEMSAGQDTAPVLANSLQRWCTRLSDQSAQIPTGSMILDSVRY